MSHSPANSVSFSRKRALVWVCDIENSSSILNDTNCVDEAEEFLKRFFYISTILIQATGGIVTKWTGDGFLAAYDIELDRKLGDKASQIFAAAWELTLLINVTQLGLECSRKFSVRHGITYEPDAILISHNDQLSKTTDIIGRSVVLAFRLSGIKSHFPNIVTQKKLVDLISKKKNPFKKKGFNRDELLKYFKGNTWSTKDICVSVDQKPRMKSGASVERMLRKTIKRAEDPELEIGPEHSWLPKFSKALATGPTWAQKTLKMSNEFTEKELLGTLKKILPLIEEANSKNKKS